MSAVEAGSALTRVHLARLNKVWRSAGWPCCDAIELELLAHGYLERHVDGSGRACVGLSPVGLQALNGHRTINRKRLDRHETLCRHTAEWIANQGRLAFVGASFRAMVNGLWKLGKPDVFSIRRTTHESGLMPIAYEIKVSRPDLLSDLAKPDKCAAYVEVSSQMFYVIREGIAQPEEIPGDCGVIIADGGGFKMLRAAPAKNVDWTHSHWMSLLMAQRVVGIAETNQLDLANCNDMGDAGLAESALQGHLLEPVSG